MNGLAAAQPGPGHVVTSVSIQPDRITLGETTTLTLALEGSAPLRVEMPPAVEKFLSPASAAVWQIAPLGPPRVQSLDGGRERWELAFRLSPFTHAERVPLSFARLRVNGEEVAFDAQAIRVRKTLDDPKPESAVPVTGIEPLPPRPATPPDASGWPFLAALIGVFAAFVIVVAVRRRRAVSPPEPPAIVAERELDRLAADCGSARHFTHPLAAIVRTFTERQFALPATRLTTAELVDATRAAGWSESQRIPLQTILERCDRARFGGVEPDGPERFELLAAARTWVAAARPDAAAPLHSPS